jgi:hypothetical protein
MMLALGVSSLQAIPISGEIHFLGTYAPIDSNGAQASLGTATGLDFNNPSLVVGASGDFSSYVTPWMSTATFVDAFNFNPLAPSPVQLWSAGGFNFTMTAVDVITQTDSLLSLLGTGQISGNGFEATAGTWSLWGGRFLFYANDKGVPGSSSDSDPVRVADGGSTLMLLGAALLGIGYAGTRMRRTAPALS